MYSMPHPRLVDHATRDAVTASIRERADLLALVQEDTGDRMRGRGNERRGPCPIHGGEGPNFAVNVSAGLYKCHTCGAGGDLFDYVGATRGLDFLSARAFLAQRAGVSLDAPLSVLAGRLTSAPRPRPRSPEEEQRATWAAELEALRAEGCMPSAPPIVYAAVLAMLSLDETGAAYLAGRGFDPDAAERYGFRALSSPAAWDVLRHDLEDGFLTAEIGLAGLHRFPWRGEMPALVIPYLSRGEVIGLRFRALDPTASKNARYRSLHGAPPELPFNADALDGTGPLHLVEGELNTYTLATYGLRAIGLPGAGTWRPEWATVLAEAIGSAGLLVAWYDADAAGVKARAALANRLQAALGSPWLARHGHAATLRSGDANDLHRAGTLRALLEQGGLL